jgi:glycosyltransferase involved in cell wall biosynthesis
MKDLSVIIPVYNEEGNIQLLYDRLKKIVARLGVDAEFIFVNDCSRDNTIGLIRHLSK